MSEQTPTNVSNADFTFKDKYGNTGLVKGTSGSDSTKLNNMVKLMNLMLNTPNSTDFINTLATKQYVDENQSSGLIPNQIIQSPVPLTDANLHLKDGALLSGSGAYSEYVDLIAEIYNSGDATTSFCSEAEWQTSNTNYGFCNKFVYDSVANTVRLPKINSEHGALIKSYHSGANWYRIYEDGFCEQGGVGDSGVLAQSALITVNLQVEYLDTNYTVISSLYDGDPNGDHTADITHNTYNLTQQSFLIRYYGNNSAEVGRYYFWQTSGYVDISDLQIAPIYEYIVVGTVSKTDIQIDIDNVMADLALKADTDLSNVPSSKGILVESYVNGASWYRVYSDGWCEQGGQTNGTYVVVNLLKPFIDMNYTLETLSLTDSDIRADAWQIGYFCGVKLSNSQIKIGTLGSWFACGYIS